MEKLKIGVFGAHRGRTMMNVLLKHPEAELVAVCDKHVPSLDGVAALAKEKDCQVALYEKFDDFIQHDMDAVVLANYANEHAPFAVRVLESGRHVMSEVLPSETMAQAVELIEAVEHSGKVYAYAENYCYMDRTFEMWRRYRRGDIGEVTYAEGEYVHDCTSIWPRITYGERYHWRNYVSPFFYCTHSLGPILSITGRRPVKVIGIATRPVLDNYLKGMSPGLAGMAGIEMVTLDNGAIAKSIHGGLKREPSSVNYEVYGSKGCMETQRFGEANLNVYVEGEKACKGALETYIPEKFVSSELAANFGSHGGSDFYATHFFIQKILGRPEGHEYSIDVYQAVDMGICGILAQRSNLQGGIAIDVPNLRNPEERDAYRNDRACTNPTAEDGLLPGFLEAEKLPYVPDEAFDYIRELSLAGKDFE